MDGGTHSGKVVAKVEIGPLQVEVAVSEADFLFFYKDRQLPRTKLRGDQNKHTIHYCIEQSI